MSVWRHLVFGTDATSELAAYWLRHLHLDGLESRYPSELSAGQRQRVGLAQVLCQSPQVLLLDEPFSALDMPVRRELRRELRRLQHETGLATVLVTHDPEEAAFLSEEVIVIAGGRALQSGTSRQVWSRPASPEVARLLGIANLHHALVASAGQIDLDGMCIGANTADLAPGTAVLWSIRPEQVLVSAESDALAHADRSSLVGTLRDIADVGTAVDLFVIAGGVEIHARTPDLVDLRVGQRCFVELPPEAISLWPAPAERASATAINVLTP
jgi:molybdate transport system permease protein